MNCKCKILTTFSDTLLGNSLYPPSKAKRRAASVTKAGKMFLRSRFSGYRFKMFVIV